MPIENFSSAGNYDPMDRLAGREPELEQAEHPLDSADNLRLLMQLRAWWRMSFDAEAENRREQQLDYDFYDHLQWSEVDKAVMAARNQAPLTYNKIKIAIDWVLGTERRTRVDGKVHPRREDEVEAAQVKSELLKYLSDTNRVPWVRSKAFKDMAIAGIGWTEESIRCDKADFPVRIGHVSWRLMWKDPFSREDDLDDSRFLHRMKYLDADYAEAMFPDRIEQVRMASTSHVSPEDEALDSELDLPQQFRRYDSRGFEMDSRRINGRTSVDRTDRLRVRLTETWFRRPVKGQRMWGKSGLNGQVFDPKNDMHATAVQQKTVSLSDAVTEEVWVAIWTDHALISLQKSPYKHGKFPFTPYFCYRRDRDGQPYGIVRGARDAQEDFNKRMSKMLWLLSSNQFHYETGAIDPERKVEVARELAKPNGMVEYAEGGLAKSRVERNLDVADAQVKLLELDGAHIHDGTGINREMLGRETNATSGRAIRAKQQEGGVTTAELFDNYRLGIQLSGEKQLSLSEQYMTMELQFRVTGERRGIDWRTINKPVFNETAGDWEYENDITRSQADFVVDQQDFRESMRMAFAEQFMDMLAKLPPETALQLLDLAIDMMDIPLKDEVVKRIREINGQADPEKGEDPEAVALKQQRQGEEQQLQLRERLAKVGLDEAKRNEVLARAQKLQLGNKGQALDIAQLLDVLLPLAPAADRLLSDKPEEEDPAHAVA